MGHSGLAVSEIGLGCNNFGRRIPGLLTGKYRRGQPAPAGTQLNAAAARWRSSEQDLAEPRSPP